MDYTNGNCQNIFTQCQRTRMRAVLQNAVRRSSLLNSTVCERPTTTPLSAFVFRNQNNCDGVVSFTDSSENIPTSWFWAFGDGGTSTLRNPTHTYTASGVYTVRLVTNNSFGTHFTTKQISVNVSSSDNIDAGPDVVACAGDSIQLNVAMRDSTASISWLPTSSLSDPTIPNPKYYALIGRTFWVIATDTVGCTARDTLTISTVPRPILDAGMDITIQWGDSLNLNPAFNKTAASWRWTPPLAFRTPGGDTLQNPLIKPTLTTTYHLLVTDTDGCMVQDSMTVVVEGGPPASIDNLTQGIGTIHLPYPNPASQEVIFSAAPITSGELELTLHDMYGRRVERIYQGKVVPGAFQYRWAREPSISAGVYLLTWEIKGKRVVQKIQLR
jgi:PKD repeat protein